MLVEILLLLLTLFLGVYFWITKHYGYFRKKGLAEAPGTFPFGSEHMWQMMTRKISAVGGFQKIVEKFPDDKLFGVYHFGQRNIVVRDLELAKMILIKDADHFIDRPAVDTEGSVKESDKIFAYFLTNLKGEEWKKVNIESRNKSKNNHKQIVFISDEDFSQPCVHQWQAKDDGSSY